MYVLVSRYTAPHERIEELLSAHREYLQRHFDAGHFVVSGRRVPWIGGLILARGLTREQLDSVIAEDPFTRAGVAETEVLEFDPRFGAVGYEERVDVPVTSRHKVVGADACPRGWAVVVLAGGRFETAVLCPRFVDVLALDASVIAVDIPIGLPTAEDRPADKAARAFVKPRGSSVFPTPPRAVLEAASYAEAREVALRLTGKSISAQAYAIGPKILEVDALAHADDRVIEVHPECSFRELAGRPLPSKHSLEGRVERRSVLAADGIDLPERLPGIPELDLLDAAAAAWSAARRADQQAVPLPEGHVERIGAIWR